MLQGDLMSVRKTLLFAAAMAAAIAVLAGTTAGERYSQALEATWSGRSGPEGIVPIYRAELLADGQDGKAKLEEALNRLLQAPDADPEVKAHAAYRLSVLCRDRGAIAQAAKLDAGLGFVTEWRVVGPFDDENKQGFDTAYGPEADGTWTGSYEGKGHSVAWRALPMAVGDGLVPLDQLLWPSEKTAGYALSFIFVERDTPCVLRGSYNESYKLWVDGEFLAGRKLYNGRALDQFADACTLRKGWNAVLVKVCNQEAGWNFMVRVTDAAGNPLPGWRATADPSKVTEAREAVLAKDGAPPKGMQVNDPEKKLREAVDKDPSPRNKGLLGEYLTLEKTFDRTEDPNVQLLREAAEGAQSDANLWLALSEAESDINRRRDALQKALDSDPGNSTALDGLARHYLRRSMPITAMDYVRQGRKADPADLSLASLEGQALLQLATEGAAAADLFALYAAHPDCTVVQEAAVDGAKALGQNDRAAKVAAAYRLQHQGDAGAWYPVLANLMATGDGPGALALFGEMASKFPMDRMVVFRKASYLLGLDRAGEAEAAVAPALAWAPDWPEGRELMGDVLQAEGRGKAALESYQQALILKPQMESVKRKVAFLTPQEEEFETRYRIDAKEISVDLGSFGGQQGVVLVDNTAVKVEPNGLSTRYVQRVIQVLQPGAVQQMQAWPISFDPDREEVRVIEASILKPDGRRVHAETMVTDALSDPQYRLYYRNRNLVLSFPSLASGDRIWIEYKMSAVGEQNDYGRYFGDWVPFAGMLPILLKQYTLVMPEDFPLFMQAKGLDVKPIVMTVQGRKVYRWVSRDIPHLQREPEMPGFSEVAPYLQLSTFEDWDALGRWYAKFIADQWELTPEMKAKVAEITTGCTTVEDRVRAIHRWVVQQTHYVGLEFGVHGFRPYKVKQIYERRFGDCKDKAILMAAMFKAAGVDACMVLTRTRDNGEILSSPATMSIFNHAICYVPELDLFLDGTAEYTGLRELPYQDRGVWVQLVWQDGRTKRVQTPTETAEGNRYDATYVVQVPEEGSDAQTAGKAVITGQECSWVRRRYQDKDKQLEMLERDLSGSFPGTRLTSAKLSDLDTLSTPVTISFEGTVGQLFKPDGKGRLSARTWLGKLNLSTMYGSLPTRSLPLEIDYPWTQTYAVTYVLPAGSSAVAPSEQKVESPFGSASRQVKEEGNRITVTVSVALTVLRVDPSEYERFRAFCQQVDRLTDERIRIATAGGRP
jgi:cellulose synthase operon protein C